MQGYHDNDLRWFVGSTLARNRAIFKSSSLEEAGRVVRAGGYPLPSDGALAAGAEARGEGEYDVCRTCRRVGGGWLRLLSYWLADVVLEKDADFNCGFL